MTAEKLSLVAGIALSLILAYTPGVSTWYEARDTIQKRLIMAGLLLASALTIYILGCANLQQTGLTCTPAGAWEIFTLFVSALIANQSTYAIAAHNIKRISATPPALARRAARK